MRIDDFLSTVGIIKRRTVAKEMADNGLIEVNGRRVKASYEVKLHDIIAIRGSRPFVSEVIDIPHGSVSKEARQNYFKAV
jgi:ribosomal 50S subunit-recycling heat shock protein